METERDREETEAKTTNKMIELILIIEKKKKELIHRQKKKSVENAELPAKRSKYDNGIEDDRRELC